MDTMELTLITMHLFLIAKKLENADLIIGKYFLKISN